MSRWQVVLVYPQLATKHCPDAPPHKYVAFLLEHILQHIKESKDLQGRGNDKFSWFCLWEVNDAGTLLLGSDICF